MFRRRRSADVGRDWSRGPEQSDQRPDGDELGHDEPLRGGPTEAGKPAGVRGAEGGPWDAQEPYPALERVDLGSLLVPVGPEHEIQLVMSEGQAAWVTVKHADNELQIQAFAGARRGALWADVRAEIAAEVLAVGGRSEETPGPFGIELVAHVPVEDGNPEQDWAKMIQKETGGEPLLARSVGVNDSGSLLIILPAAAEQREQEDGDVEADEGLRLVRFVGIDGPRWFVRGLFTGPAALGGEAASLLEDVFRDVVVVRGEHPEPPRELLELLVPPEAKEALEQFTAAEETKLRTGLNFFERPNGAARTRGSRPRRPIRWAAVFGCRAILTLRASP